MKINIETEISNKYDDEIKVIIQTNQITNQLQQIIDYLENITNNPKKIIATQNNNIFLINLEEIICFYSEFKKIYCKTKQRYF